MAKRIPAEAGRAQILYETILKWFAFGIGTFHISLSILFYFLESLTITLRKVEKWAVLALILAAVFYLFYTKAKYPRLVPRIRKFLKELFCPEMTLLVIIFVWFVICTISADGRYTANFFKINDMHLFNVFVDAMILFPMAFLLADRPKAMEHTFGILTAVMTVVMIWVLWNLLHLKLINLPDGGQIGMTAEIRLSINCHGNTTGAYSEVILLLCVCMAVMKKGITRWLYAAASIIHYIVMILSNSRACFGAATLALAFVAAKVLYDAFGNRKTWQRLLAAFAAAGAVAAISLLLRNLIFEGFESITHLSALLAASKSGGNSEVAGGAAESAARTLDLNGHGRNVIWGACLASIFTDIRHILCGVTPAGVISEVSIHSNGVFKEYAHNQFLEIAVSLGVPGLIVYCAWLYRQARYCLQDTLKKPGAYLPAVILMLVAANMMESTLMFYWFLPESIFFLVTGVITYSHKKEKA